MASLFLGVYLFHSTFARAASCQRQFLATSREHAVRRTTVTKKSATTLTSSTQTNLPYMPQPDATSALIARSSYAQAAHDHRELLASSWWS